jgi:hypothetical protein
MNNEGTKNLHIKSEANDSQTFLTFTLYDNKFCELYPSQKFHLEKEISLEDFHFSHN